MINTAVDPNGMLYGFNQQQQSGSQMQQPVIAPREPQPCYDHHHATQMASLVNPHHNSHALTGGHLQLCAEMQQASTPRRLRTRRPTAAPARISVYTRFWPATG